MDEVVSARIRLEGERADAGSRRGCLPCSSVHGRARSWTCCMSRPSAKSESPRTSAPANAGSRPFRLQLLRTTNRADRQRLLDEIFAAEEALAPMTTELFARSRTSVRRPVPSAPFKPRCGRTNCCFEFALGEPAPSVVVTRRGAGVRLPGGRRSWLRPTHWCPLREAGRKSRPRRRLSGARS